MERVVWTTTNPARRTAGLRNALRSLSLGQELLASGLQAAEIGSAMRAARYPGRWYEARTLAAGALVRRVE